MNTLTLPARHGVARPRFAALRLIALQLLQRERRLTLFALGLLALVLPLALAWGLDERMLRGANVWIKPIKFALSIALLALTTAWFVGHLKPGRRASRAVDRTVWLLIAAGSFELGYIALQAGLGEGSHYNVGDAFHATMYALMGVGAIGLTATQPMLAWELHRHADTTRPEAYRQAVKIGLLLTFVFGAGVGGLLSAQQPPVGPALPVLGWALQGGDLRPAHFVGIHAQQLLPLLGAAIAAFRLPQARAWLLAATLGYSALFAALVAWGIA